MAESKSKPQLPVPVRKALILLLYCAVWWLISVIVNNEVLLPGPAETLKRLGSLLLVRANRLSLLASVGRVLLGMLIGMVTGILLGVLTGILPVAEELLRPLRNIVRATPVTSFILLFILWFSSSMVPVLIAALMTVPIIWVSVADGLKAVDRKLIEMVRVFRLPVIKRIRDLYIPSVLPGFRGAMKNALGFAWKSGVAAEILSIPRVAVGSLLYRAKLNIETTDLFAWTLGIVILSALTEYLLTWFVERRTRV